MPDVLIRDLTEATLAQLKAAAADRKVSLQTYLRDAIHAQIDYIRRQAALTAAATRLSGQPAVTIGERQAVLAAIETAHAGRAERLGGDRCR